MTTAWICTACGTQYEPAERPAERCDICADERQFVPAPGQRWTTLAALATTRRNAWRRHEPGLLSLTTVPQFAIGQRAFLVRTAAGNVLWDCIALLDDATVELIEGLGGLRAIGISHPHYYTTVAEWANAFGVPVYLHTADRAWLRRPDPWVLFWEGETRELSEGITLIRCGGHFPGATVLHWPGGDDGRGVLLTGDVLQALPDRSHVSFMYSYPNLIPLSSDEVRGIVAAVDPFRWDRLYGAFDDREIVRGARDAVRRSAARYIDRLQTR